MPSRKSFLTVPLLVELTHMLAPPGPLLPLLVVLTHVLAPPGPLLPLLVAQCLLIAPNFSTGFDPGWNTLDTSGIKSTVA